MFSNTTSIFSSLIMNNRIFEKLFSSKQCIKIKTSWLHFLEETHRLQCFVHYKICTVRYYIGLYILNYIFCGNFSMPLRVSLIWSYHSRKIYIYFNYTYSYDLYICIIRDWISLKWKQRRRLAKRIFSLREWATCYLRLSTAEKFY